MSINAKDIISFFENRAPHPLTPQEIVRMMGIGRQQRKELLAKLDELADKGALVRLKGKRYALPRRVNLVVGTISLHRDGYGFVKPSEGTDKDVFIPARFAGEAMHGDRVVVRVERGARSGKPEGRIIRVEERAHQSVVGRYEASRKFGYVVPADPRLSHDVYIPRSAAGKARPGEIVIARIDSYPSRNRNPEGTVVEILGEPDDPNVEVLTIVHKHGLPHRFPQSVLDAAEAVPDQVSEEERVGRVDLRDVPTVTIDGETAKDFDDAVAVRREDGGNIRLWVSIADVGHYVREGSIIDVEAYERGTSVYFPGQCIPMLPEKLSNGICSLNPHVERLTMTAEILFDRQGERLESRFYASVIRSHARLTYTEVSAVIERDDAQVKAAYPHLVDHLQVMKELALRLTAMRRRRGSLDFDLPEAEIILDLRGRIEDIVRSERNLAHRLVEEFMLAANEAVARFVSDHEAPLLFRVHEAPDPEKLQELRDFAQNFGCDLKLQDSKVRPGQLQELLNQVEGRPEERLINQVLLRTMQQARYRPENIGHFGLAAETYCHFTSPIRRYPDLIVHRILSEVIVHKGLPPHRRQQFERKLPQAGEDTSTRERRAMDAEREIVTLKKCQFMVDRVGEEFDGFISGVQSFGFFVELKGIFVEGLVHISTLEDDFYHFEEEHYRLIGENSRKIFQVGGSVRVRVNHVSIERREIDFILVGPPSGAEPGSEHAGQPA